jgi:hypothetical protein
MLNLLNKLQISDTARVYTVDTYGIEPDTEKAFNIIPNVTCVHCIPRRMELKITS